MSSLQLKSVTTQLGLVSRSKRRRTAGIKLVVSLLQGYIDSSSWLSLIFCFRVLQRSFRSTGPFYVPQSAYNYLLNEPMRRMMINANADPMSLANLSMLRISTN